MGENVKRRCNFHKWMSENCQTIPLFMSLFSFDSREKSGEIVTCLVYLSGNFVKISYRNNYTLFPN